YISIEGLEINAEMKIGSNYPVSKFQTIGIFLEGSYNAPLNSVKIYNNFIQNVSAEAILANYFDKLTISFNKFYNNTRNPESKGTLALLNGIYTESNTNYHNFIQGNTFEKNGMSDTILKSSCIPAIYMNLETNQVFRESAKTLIHNNILYTNHGGGFIANNVHGLQLVNNTFYKNSENKICQNAEVVLIGSKFIDLFNNIFYSSDLKPGSQAFGTSNINAKNNLYYNTTSFIPGINNIHANPDFENIRIKEGLFNFKLKGSSPAINKGLDSLLSDTDFEGNIRKLDLHVDIGAMEFTNRLLPSLKKLRLGPGTKGIKTKWISLYTKDQKMYTIWNEQFLEFTVRVFDLQGNILAHKTPRISGDSSYEIDFSKFRTGYYTILAFNESGNYIERLYVK
ncbi:MAG: right-handed parallel beta-helix repeat-containing protein, partial [Saprospiraceae bacterium]